MGFISTMWTLANNTASRLGEHALAIPQTMNLFLRHKPAQKIMTSTAYTIAYDAMLIASVVYCQQQLDQLTRDHLMDDTDDSWLSSNTALSLMLETLNYGTWAWSLKRALQGQIRRSMLLMMAPSAFAHQNEPEQSTRCIDEKCNWKREIKGEARSTVTYLGNRMVLFGIRQIPYAGTPISMALNVPVTGNYIARTALSNRCDRHIDLQFELSLTLGLSHQIMVLFFWMACYFSIGSPSAASMAAFADVMLLMLIANARQVKHPMIPAEQQTLPYEPMSAWEDVVGFSFDWAVAGGKKILPERLKAGQQRFSPEQIATFIRYVTGNQIYQLAMPKMLHSRVDFIRDPVIATKWPEIQASIVSGTQLIVGKIDLFRKLQIGNATRFQIIRTPIAILLKQLIGLPTKLGGFLLEKLPDESIRIWFIDAGQMVAGMQINVASIDGLEAKPHALRDDEPPPSPAPLPATDTPLRQRVFGEKPKGEADDWRNRVFAKPQQPAGEPSDSPNSDDWKKRLF